MIPHLSSEQLSEYVLGQPGPEVALHVQHCAACRAELAQFREALGALRGAVRAWSAEQASVALAIPASVPEPRFWSGSHQLAWALVIAAVCVIASFVLPWRAKESAVSNDAVILNQVDAQVSRTVPASMEPLMRLVVQNQ